MHPRAKSLRSIHVRGKPVSWPCRLQVWPRVTGSHGPTIGVAHGVASCRRGRWLIKGLGRVRHVLDVNEALQTGAVTVPPPFFPKLVARPNADQAARRC